MHVGAAYGSNLSESELLDVLRSFQSTLKDLKDTKRTGTWICQFHLNGDIEAFLIGYMVEGELWTYFAVQNC